jgi:hypothetical protein
MQDTTCGGEAGAMECDTELPEERVGGRSSTIVLFFCAPTATIAAACHTKPPHLPDRGRGLSFTHDTDTDALQLVHHLRMTEQGQGAGSLSLSRAPSPPRALSATLMILTWTAVKSTVAPSATCADTPAGHAGSAREGARDGPEKRGRFGQCPRTLLSTHSS